MIQKFNYHSHTYRCKHCDDLKDEDFILDYIKMGFKKIAFTDHCPEKNEIDKDQNARMKYNQREEYLNSIKYLKEKYADKIEILSGYEVEYLPGEEENIQELKKETDKIVLGQHFVYGDDRKLKRFGQDDFSDEELIRYVQYINRAMQLGIPDIVAHPDMFMLRRKRFGELERKISNMICQSAQTYDIPLEINLKNIFKETYRQNENFNKLSMKKQKEKLENVSYPCKEFWEIASQYNIKVLYGIDAHYKGQILACNELSQFAKDIIGEETLNKLNFIEE